MRKFLLFLLSTFLIFITPLASFAENFYLEKNNVYVDVLKNGTYKIKEVLTIRYTTPCHGIIRDIPVKYKLSYPDGKHITRLSKIDNIKVFEIKNGDTKNKIHFSTYIEGNNYEVKIGDADRLVSGEQTIEIDYDYINQKDPHKGFDEFYFNIIGTYWDVKTNSAEFRINMPFDFNKEKVGVSVGKYGQAGFQDIAEYETDGKYVSGKINRPLEPNEGITVRIELPDNYFTHEDTKTAAKPLLLLLSFITAAASFFVWSLTGKDAPVIPVVNFRPPEGKSSAEVGAEYKGCAGEKEIVGLLVYLASKGYIHIDMQKSSFTLTKKKLYDGGKEIEKDFIRAIFASGNTVTKKTLEYSTTFYKKCEDLISGLTQKTKAAVYEKKSTSEGKILVLFAGTILTFCAALFALTDYSYMSFSYLLGSDNIIFDGLILAGILIFAVYFESRKTMSQKLSLSVFTIIFIGSGLAGMLWLNEPVFYNPDYKVAAAAFGAFVVSLVCLANLRKRSEYGTKVLGEIEGFKKFIETAKKEEIETMTKDDPEYCFEILPYAYVLGVSDTWLAKIEGIVQSRNMTGEITPYAFNSFANEFANVSKPSTANGGVSKSSGSSGGGGFSGGGGGGGGGHSW